MSILSTILGAVLVLGIMYEVLWTAGAEGAGPLTKRLGHYEWQFLLRVYRRLGRNWVLVAGGVGVFVWTLMFWVATLWAGWSLIFWGTDAVVAASTGAAADGSDVVYFVGYTIFTLGNGDFAPQGGPWQVLTPIASLSGLFVVTFSISYLVSIIQAMTHKRQVAVRISVLGRSGEEIILSMCSPGDLAGLTRNLEHLSGDLATVQQRLLSYPVLHYMHSKDRVAAVAPSVAALDEALSIVELGFPEPISIDHGVYRPARQVITELLSTLDQAFVDPADEAPPVPSLARLRAAGFATIDEARFQDRMNKLAARRRLLRGWVEGDGWDWRDVSPHEEITPPTQVLAA